MMATDEQHDQRSDSGAEAHSGGYQPDNVNRAESLEAGRAGEIDKSGESHEQDEHGNVNARNKLTPVAHGQPLTQTDPLTN
jgi:hypothetical protein